MENPAKYFHSVIVQTVFEILSYMLLNNLPPNSAYNQGNVCKQLTNWIALPHKSNNIEMHFIIQTWLKKTKTGSQ